MKKAYFQYYETFENVVQKFKTSEERDAMRSKIINYGLFGIEPESLNDKEEMVWDVLKDLIDDQKHRRETNTENRKTKSFETENETKETTQEENEKESAETTNKEEKTLSEQKTNETTEKENKSPFEEKTNEKEIKSPFLTEKENKSPSSELNRIEMNRNELNRNGVERKEEAPGKPDAHTHAQYFQKPTLLDVQNYCKERNNGINAERFLDYYEAKGWKVGSSPMKDWKAAVRTWEQKNETPHYAPTPQKTLPDDRLTF